MIRERFFAASHPNRPNDVDILVEVLEKDGGGVTGHVINGGWAGYFTPEGMLHVLHVADDRPTPYIVVWQGHELPKTRGYNDQIAFIKASLRGEDAVEDAGHQPA